MADFEPQPAKKQCIELGDSLPLPAGVIIPSFYREECDAGIVSTALQLGADAVYYLRSTATEHRLKELSVQKTFELTESITKLRAQLSFIQDETNREVARRVEEHKLAMEQDLELRGKRHDEMIAQLQSLCDELNQQCSDSITDLEIEKEATSQLDAVLQDARKSECQKAADDAKRTRDVLQCQVEYLSELYKSLDKDSKQWQELFKQAFELARERQQAAVNSALAASHNIQIKGATGEFNLATLIKKAFGMVEDFVLDDTTHTKSGKSGDFLAKIWGLQTLWDCKNYSKNVDGAQITKIKRDLSENPNVDVAFLVSLNTSISGHGDCIFDVEFIPPRQTLVYVNQLTKNGDPVNLLQVFARPLFKALLHVKQAYADGREYDAGSWARFVKQWKVKVSDQLNDLQTEQRELDAEKRQSNKRFTEREEHIANRKEALQTLLDEVCPPQAGAKFKSSIML